MAMINGCRRVLHAAVIKNLHRQVEVVEHQISTMVAAADACAYMRVHVRLHLRHAAIILRSPAPHVIITSYAHKQPPSQVPLPLEKPSSAPSAVHLSSRPFELLAERRLSVALSSPRRLIGPDGASDDEHNVFFFFISLKRRRRSAEARCVSVCVSGN